MMSHDKLSHFKDELFLCAKMSKFLRDFCDCIGIDLKTYSINPLLINVLSTT